MEPLVLGLRSSGAWFLLRQCLLCRTQRREQSTQCLRDVELITTKSSQDTVTWSYAGVCAANFAMARFLAKCASERITLSNLLLCRRPLVRNSWNGPASAFKL